MKQLHLTISGCVQGVFFRAFVKKKAQSLGLNGFVRNAPDGTVEVVAQGDFRKLHALAQACHQGPAGARVDAVKEEYSAAKEKMNSFVIWY